MSGGLPFWIMVLLCWSMSFQLTTWTFSVVPVFSLNFVANWFQNFAVFSFEYSAATRVIDDALSPSPELESAPVPPPQAARASAATARPATPAVRRARTIGDPFSRRSARQGRRAMIRTYGLNRHHFYHVLM